jgi:hypothetical protein
VCERIATTITQSTNEHALTGEDALIQFLADKRFLIILDNCDEINFVAKSHDSSTNWFSGGDGLLTRIMRSASHCRFVMTCRSDLQADFGVTTLSVQVQPLPNEAAMQMLREFDLEGVATEAQLGELCQLCGSIPFCLKIVGSMLSPETCVESTEEFIERLKRRKNFNEVVMGEVQAGIQWVSLSSLHTLQN